MSNGWSDTVLEILASNQPIVSLNDPAIERLSTLQELFYSVVVPLNESVGTLDLFVWSLGTGRVQKLVADEHRTGITFESDPSWHGDFQPFDVLDRLERYDGNMLLVAIDLHPFLSGNFLDIAIVSRIRDLYFSLQNAYGEGEAGIVRLYKYLVLLGQDITIPTDLSCIQECSTGLPNRLSLQSLMHEEFAGLDQVAKAQSRTFENKLTESMRSRLVRSAGGLTMAEFSNLLRRGARRFRYGDDRIVFDEELIEFVAQERMRKLQKLGARLIEPPKVESGGYVLFKEWVKSKLHLFDMPDDGILRPVPKGAVLIGPPGTGKTFLASICSHLMGIPGLIVDIGELMDSLVGASEANTRRLLEMAESLAPCILVLDEVDKAGLSPDSARSDGGTSSRVLGQLLTWMSNRRKPIFVLATMNRITGVPIEFTRTGRFDEIFYVGLPNTLERTEILKVHVEKYGYTLPEKVYGELAIVCSGFSGAEIEGVVDSVWTHKGIDAKALGAALQAKTPLSVIQADEFEKLTEFAGRARPASIEEVKPTAGRSGKQNTNTGIIL